MMRFCQNLLALLPLLVIAFNQQMIAASVDSDAILEELSDVLKNSPAKSVAESLTVAKRDDIENNEIQTDVALEDNTNKKASCKNVDHEDNCLRDSIKGLCTTSDMRKRCPRTCMVCCADSDLYTSYCSAIKKFCFTKKHIDRMKHLCAKTCGHCGKMPAPPPCLNSKFGCCWDKNTFASGPVGSATDNCPPCKDLKSDVFCKRFESDCYELYKTKGKQVREYCPKTCKLCGAGAICKDHPKQQYQCPIYKDEGLCESNSKIMSFWCAKTCGFCKCSDNPVANCAFLAAHRACTMSAKRMKTLCPSTCGFCNGGNKVTTNK